MSTRAKTTSLLAGAGVLVLGWKVGTANAQTMQSAPVPTGTVTSQAASTETTQGSTQTSQSTSGTASAPDSSSSSPSPAAAATTGLKDGTYTGQTVSYRYGQVSVKVTISNGTITSVSEDLVSDGEHRSEEINSYAVPTLRSGIKSANSAEVSTVSGATFTSEAYLESLQSALDQAKS